MAGAIEADIVYYAPSERPGPGERPNFTALPLAPARVSVRDLRDEPAPTLDREGFMLVDAPTAVRDFHDLDQIDRIYNPEVDELLRRVTGCTSTICSSPAALRSSAPADARPKEAQQTGSFVHADYDADGAAMWLHRALPPAEAERRLRGRFAIFNVWRTFTPPPQDVPLALCDARSVRPGDKQPCTITLQTRVGEVRWGNLAYFHNPAHRWFYCSDMRRDEAFLFRSFDSDPAHSEVVPHSAFVDRNCPPGVSARESVEIRFFAFYGD